jgi:hypothetical protein
VTPGIAARPASINLVRTNADGSGGTMISDHCDFEEFVLQTDGRNFDDIITMADREATEAERRFYHSSVADGDKLLCGQQYAECLKGFITFMRYGIKPACLDPVTLLHFDRIREEALQVKRPSDTRH